jgi:hypothetical protein
MGTKSPARIPLAMRRKGCETVEQMHRANWDVLSRCDACALVMRVNLAAIIKVNGPQFSLWNRKARCRRIGCVGFVDFQAKAPGMECHDLLIAPWPQ